MKIIIESDEINKPLIEELFKVCKKHFIIENKFKIKIENEKQTKSQTNK